jgi:hypothetical protein
MSILKVLARINFSNLIPKISNSVVLLKGYQKNIILSTDSASFLSTKSSERSWLLCIEGIVICKKAEDKADKSIIINPHNIAVNKYYQSKKFILTWAFSSDTNTAPTVGLII